MATLTDFSDGVFAVNDLPCRKQVKAVLVNFATKNATSGDVVKTVPIAAGQIVNKVYTIVKTACTASTTGTLGWATAAGSDADDFDATTIDLATAQSTTAPAKPAASLEATDNCGAGMFFPVAGHITLVVGGANPIVGEVLVVAEITPAPGVV